MKPREAAARKGQANFTCRQNYRILRFILNNVAARTAEACGLTSWTTALAADASWTTALAGRFCRGAILGPTAAGAMHHWAMPQRNERGTSRGFAVPPGVC